MKPPKAGWSWATTEEANEELELIDAPLRSHPDVLEVRWGIYAKVTDWETCLHIAKAMVKLDPYRFTGSGLTVPSPCTS